ncbi:hypothetical protein BH24GEM3_BH24GEM3_06710 [soil metagenome]
MSSPVTPAPAAVQEEAGKLIEQRALLKGWLARLEECSTDVPDHITARVRGDYEERLRSIAEQLGPHSEGIRSELDEMQGLLGVAEEAHTAAADALGEAQLRQRIGEIATEEWAQREPELRSALDAAAAETQRVRRECERLGELLAEIEGEQETEGTVGEEAEEATSEPSHEPAVAGSEAEPLSMLHVPAVPEPAAAAEAAEPQGADLPWLALIDSVAGDDPALDAEDEMDEREFHEWLAGAQDEEEEVEFGANAEEIRLADDSGFLEELDRAIAASASPPRTRDNGRSRAAEAGTRATLVCKECGSVNDSRTAFCEICGAELA